MFQMKFLLFFFYKENCLKYSGKAFLISLSECFISSKSYMTGLTTKAFLGSRCNSYFWKEILRGL